MFKCYSCDKMILVGTVKYHTADKSKVFCGAECSLKYYTQLKEEDNEKRKLNYHLVCYLLVGGLKVSLEQ